MIGVHRRCAFAIEAGTDPLRKHVAPSTPSNRSSALPRAQADRSTMHSLSTPNNNPAPQPLSPSSPHSLRTGIINQLGPDNLDDLKKIYASYAADAGAAAGAEEEDDDDVPELVENFEEVSEAN